MRKTLFSIFLPVALFVAMASGLTSLAASGQEKVTFAVS